MTIAEKIKALQARLAQAETARNEMVNKSVTEDRALSDEEVTAYNTANTTIVADSKQLEILIATEKSIAASAIAVPAIAPAALEVGTVGKVKSNAPKGSSFTRTAMVLAKAKGNLSVAERLAETHYKDDAVVNGIIKAAVAAGSTQVAAWAGNLIYPEQYSADFIELLYPQTVLGRLNLRKVPFNVTIAGQTGGTTVGWVGESQPKPVTSAAFNRIFLEWTKVGAISVLSDELIRFSNPAAEALVQADLLKATAQGLDSTFTGSAAAVANVSPQGMQNGVAAIASTGSDYESLRKDVRALLAPFIAANYDLSSAVIVMNPSRSLAISSMLTPLGVVAFPTMDGLTGGHLLGLPVITSNNVATNVLQLYVTSQIYLSEDAGPQIDMSREASIIMDSAPGVGGALTAQPVSMFQTGQIALKIEQFINWSKRRTLCAGAISGVAYGD